MNNSSQSEDQTRKNSVLEEEGTSSPLEVSESNSATTNEIPSFGWSSYAERINGRFAMIGFVAVLLIEGLTRQTFLHWSGLFM